MNRRLVLGAVLGAAAQLCGAGLLLTSAWLIVRAAEHPPVMYLMVAIVSVRFFGIGRAVFRYGERLQTHWVALTRMVDDRVTAYRHLNRAAPFGLPHQRRGDIISRVVSDVTTAQDALLRIRLPWVYGLVSCAVVIAVTTWVSPVGALVVAGHAVLCLGVARLFVARSVLADSVAVSQGRATMSAESVVLASTSRDLVAYGATSSFTRQLHESIDTQSRSQLRTSWFGCIWSALVLLSTGAATAAIALTAGSVLPVMTGVLLLAPVALLEPLLSIVEAEQLRPAVLAARRRLHQLSELRSPVTEPLVAAEPPTGHVLTLRGVVPGWGGALTRPVSATVAPGRVIGISGSSGIGKSTLALTMTRLIAAREGALTLDGIDYRELDGAAVRARVGMCGQDDILFNTTIRENLRIAAPRADDAAMQVVLDRVGLGPLLERMPDGLDTTIGAVGSSLSGGERQRLAMARLLLGGHRVLIFDEPTEHLDHDAAASVLADILTLGRDHAVVLISHSPNVLAACDEVIHLTRPDDATRTTPLARSLSHA